jgi:hypothetical protein
MDVTGNHGGADIWVVKIDSLGAIQWQKSLGGTADDKATQVRQTTDGGYVVTGTSASNDGDVTGNNGGDDIWIAKLDNSGSIQWQGSFGGSSAESSKSVLQTTDGYVLSGLTNSGNGDVTVSHGGSDYWLVKLNNSGGLVWQKTFGGSLSDIGGYADLTQDGGLVQTGSSSSTNFDVTGNHGNFDCWVIKLDYVTGLQESSTETLGVYPNPSNGNFTITDLEKNATVHIYDLRGKLIKQINTAGGDLTIDLSEQPGALYFLRCISKEGTCYGKVLVQ